MVDGDDQRDRASPGIGHPLVFDHPRKPPHVRASTHAAKNGTNQAGAQSTGRTVRWPRKGQPLKSINQKEDRRQSGSILIGRRIVAVRVILENCGSDVPSDGQLRLFKEVEP
jgi:hypothetical protein